MKRIVFSKLIVALLLTITSQSAFSQGNYPKGPEASMTPGELCNRPSEIRYPERIDYCERDVEPELKYQVIRAYDEHFGYNIQKMKRSDFKIDHLIPLCAGGENSAKNLWPQHKSVYEVTDPMEHIGCEKLAEGSIKQKVLIEKILAGKNDLSKVPAIMKELNSL